MFEMNRDTERIKPLMTGCLPEDILARCASNETQHGTAKAGLMAAKRNGIARKFSVSVHLKQPPDSKE